MGAARSRCRKVRRARARTRGAAQRGAARFSAVKLCLDLCTRPKARAASSYPRPGRSARTLQPTRPCAARRPETARPPAPPRRRAAPSERPRRAARAPPPGDVVLDLGANVGAFARMAAPVIGASGAVYAVEPIEPVCRALRLNSERFRRWAEARQLPVGRIVPVHAGGRVRWGAGGDACRGRPPRRGGGAEGGWGCRRPADDCVGAGGMPR